MKPKTSLHRAAGSRLPHKKFLRQLVLTCIIFAPFSLSAKEIKIRDITLQIDDNFKAMDTKNPNYLFAAKRGKIFIVLASYTANPEQEIAVLKKAEEVELEFPQSKILNEMDTIFFGLSDAELLKTDNEKDYTTKHYQRAKGIHIVTHTLY